MSNELRERLMNIDAQDEYRDEKILNVFTQLYRESNLTKAVEWYELIKSGMTPEAAYMKLTLEV